MSVDWSSERSRNGAADEIPLPAAVGGRLWLAGKHYVGPDADVALERTATTTIVCLNERHELADRYPAYVDWLRANAPARAVWWPIPDLHAPTIDAAGPVLADLLARLQRGERLLVHCGAGVGRAGTVAAALLVRTGVEVASALETVAAHRPLAGPESDAQRALVADAARGVSPRRGPA